MGSELMDHQNTKLRIIVICTGNSCRSQMAEGWFKLFAPESAQVVSAGSNPTGHVHPIAIEVMGEAGVDIRRFESKPLTQFLKREFDYVITVCEHAAETCPVFPGPGERIHWPIEDPAENSGSEDEVKGAFREARDLIRKKIENFLSVVR